jgi:hypothetical protein
MDFEPEKGFKKSSILNPAELKIHLAFESKRLKMPSKT